MCYYPVITEATAQQMFQSLKTGEHFLDRQIPQATSGYLRRKGLGLYFLFDKREDGDRLGSVEVIMRRILCDVTTCRAKRGKGGEVRGMEAWRKEVSKQGGGCEKKVSGEDGRYVPVRDVVLTAQKKKMGKRGWR